MGFRKGVGIKGILLKIVISVSVAMRDNTIVRYFDMIEMVTK